MFLFAIFARLLSKHLAGALVFTYEFFPLILGKGNSRFSTKISLKPLQSPYPAFMFKSPSVSGCVCVGTGGLL